MPLTLSVDFAAPPPVHVSKVEWVQMYSRNLQLSFYQWPFQVPKLEVPTIYEAYVRPM